MEYSIQSTLVDSINGDDRLLWVIVTDESDPQWMTVNEKVGMATLDRPELAIQFSHLFEWQSMELSQVPYYAAREIAKVYGWDVIWVVDEEEIFALPVEESVHLRYTHDS